MQLTQEEIKIINLITQGSTNIAIAEEIGYSEAAIKKKLNRIYKKHNVNNRIELINKLLKQLKLSILQNK